MSTPWRQHMRALAKGADEEHPPLFAPVIFGAAAQIEALEVSQILTDATQLSKCLAGTRQLLDMNTIYVSVPSGAQAEALGAKLNYDHWPPRVTQGPGAAAQDKDENTLLSHPRIAASIETCRRLANTQADDIILIAGLTGPAALIRELTQSVEVSDKEDLYEHCGALLLALVRTLGEVGVHAIWFQETDFPTDAEDENEIWRDTLSPILNVAKFHKLPVLLNFTGAQPDAIDAWPNGCIACARLQDETKTPGCTISPDCCQWQPLAQMSNRRVILTAGELDANTKLADLHSHITRLTR